VQTAQIFPLAFGLVPADKAASVKLIGIEGNRVVYEVGSGRYQFRIAR
jgi:hypothetical protein